MAVHTWECSLHLSGLGVIIFKLKKYIKYNDLFKYSYI